MKISKNQVSNLLLLAFIALMIFSPVGTHIKVWVNKVISFSPSTIEEADREVLNTYDWNLRAIETKAVEDFNMAKGKVTIVNLWATWCPPCIAEMPDLQDLYDEYGDRVNFYFVSSEKKEPIQKFLNKNKYTIPVYQPLSVAPETIASRSIPATYLIDKSGKIVIKKKGAAKWNSTSVKEQIEILLAK